MTEDEARIAIAQEWHLWLNGRSISELTETERIRFFGYLHVEKPHLLAFDSQGNKWHRVKSWIAQSQV